MTKFKRIHSGVIIDVSDDVVDRFMEEHEDEISSGAILSEQECSICDFMGFEVFACDVCGCPVCEKCLVEGDKIICKVCKSIPTQSKIFDFG